MPELPEIICRAREMDGLLRGRRIAAIEVLQPKCLNVTPEAFRAGLVGTEVRGTTNRGKWLLSDTANGHLLLNLGMGGEILLVDRDRLPENRRIRFDFEDGMALAVNFWWFGYAHYVSPGELDRHPLVSRLGPGALDLDRAEFRDLLSNRRGGVKSFLLNQSNIAGIGNAYIHDILFRAHLHPLRSIATLREAEIDGLHAALRTEFERSVRVGGASYEVDLRGAPGGFGSDDLLVGYREGRPCPECGTPIEKIKTGSNAGFICPQCQPLVS